MIERLRAKSGRVLQGYFGIEPFRGPGIRASRPIVVQPMASGRRAPAPVPPRPDLLPAKMRGMVGQPRSEPSNGLPRSSAPRAALLPGMGAASVGEARAVVQARPTHGVSMTPVPAGTLRVIGQGRPLEPAIRQGMEAFFQTDFSGVRVHEGTTARSIGALAFTLGDEIHFAPGLYDPSSRDGMALLGHELAHVVQQRAGRVENPYGQGIAIVQDPALELEAEQMGQQVAEELWRGARGGQARPAATRRSGWPVMRKVMMLAAAKDDKKMPVAAPAPAAAGAGAGAAAAAVATDVERVASEAGRMAGMEMFWMPSGRFNEGLLGLKKGTDFAKFLFSPEAFKFDAKTSLNCWEFVFAAAMRAGVLTSPLRLRQVYESDGFEKALMNICSNMRNYPAQRPNRGDMVFFAGLSHVAIATGNVQKGAYPYNGAEIISFWPPPKETKNFKGPMVATVQLTTVEAVLFACEMLNLGAMNVQLGVPNWAALNDS